ncbi:MAG: hypothetical protein ACR2MW_05650 [Chthoniobacterales bacterium]
MKSIGRTLIIVALCLSLGGQWVALQSVAWATMLVSNSRHAPLGVAAAQTFDGAHPCGLCHAVTEGRKSEKKSASLPAVVKLDLIYPDRVVVLTPAATRYDYARFSVTVPKRFLAPRVPPPRFFLS